MLALMKNADILENIKAYTDSIMSLMDIKNDLLKDPENKIKLEKLTADLAAGSLNPAAAKISLAEKVIKALTNDLHDAANNGRVSPEDITKFIKAAGSLTSNIDGLIEALVKSQQIMGEPLDKALSLPENIKKLIEAEELKSKQNALENGTMGNITESEKTKDKVSDKDKDKLSSIENALTADTADLASA